MVRPSAGRTLSSDIGSGDVWHGVIRQGQGLALGPGRIGTGRCDGVGLLISALKVFEDSFDHIDLVDECDDAHVATADNIRADRLRRLSESVVPSWPCGDYWQGARLCGLTRLCHHHSRRAFSRPASF